MKILYIFPHPDDESFGPAHAISKQVRDGHEVFLLTLTKGEATKQRHRLGLSKSEMGKIRYKEMLDVAKVLSLSDLKVIDLPDSGLKELDPRDIEGPIEDHIRKVKPEVVVTYPVHGISGFQDHLVTHAVVKRLYCRLLSVLPELKRLAFHTLSEEQAKKSKHFKLHGSTSSEIDCTIEVEDRDIETAKKALDCYVTYSEVIEKTGVKDSFENKVHFEFFRESFEPVVSCLASEL